MSKRTYESGSGKRKKAIAKADALRAVIEKREPTTQFVSVPEGSTPEAVTDPECRSRLRQDPALLFRTRRWGRNKKFVKIRTRSHFFIFSSSRSLRAFHI